ncbi:MAG: hypothetical protein V7709_15460 [Halioglobus sp.]
MKPFFSLFFALMMLINSTVAFAHMAIDIHDSHEAVHVHTGVDHADDSVNSDPDHDGGAHFHLCAVALGSAFATTPLATGSTVTPFAHLRVNISTSPPVPPPNA